MAIRLLQLGVLGRLTNASRRFALLLALPVADLLQLGAWSVPFFSDRINWRGTKARLGPGTLILPLRAEGAEV